MNFIKTAAILLTLAVIIGAFGAHGIKPHINPDRYASFRTGVEYHFYHGLGMLLITLLSTNNLIDHKRMRLIQLFLIFGIFLFSGSLYLLSTIEITGWEGLSILGPVTPLGGILFILAWVITAISLKNKE